MNVDKSFVRLDSNNMQKYYTAHKLTKGALVKYRLNHETMMSYHLVEAEEEWRVGVVSTINWYIVPPYSTYAIDKFDEERVCYDLSVHNVSEACGIELINLQSNEIFLLTN